MFQIILYFAIITLGFIIGKYNLIPSILKKHLNFFQSLSLFILLTIMGYKIGSNPKIISNLYTIGINSLLIAIFSMIGSFLITFFIFRKGELND